MVTLCPKLSSFLKKKKASNLSKYESHTCTAHTMAKVQFRFVPLLRQTLRNGMYM